MSSSKNTAMVLDVTGTTDLFEVRVDGVVAAEVGLPGKPDPAMYLEAARRLGVDAGALGRRRGRALRRRGRPARRFRPRDRRRPARPGGRAARRPAPTWSWTTSPR